MHIAYCYDQERHYQEHIIFDKQFEFGILEEVNKTVQLEHCSLWAINIGI